MEVVATLQDLTYSIVGIVDPQENIDTHVMGIHNVHNSSIMY